MSEKNIYALFSIDNNYDQPDNNLVAWWHDKPSLEVLSKALGYSFPSDSDNVTLSIVKIWGGERQRLDYAGTTYRLESIGPGKLDNED
jgi:hypothetical protein